MKVLIIRFSSIGDIVLTTPVIRCIKQQVNGAEVHFATKRAYAGLLSENPYIDKLHLLDDSLFALISKLRKERFNYVVDLHNNLRTTVIKTLLLKKSKAFSKLNFKKWLLTNFKWNTLPKKHIVDRYMAAARKLNVKNDNQGLDYFIPAADEVNITETFTDKFLKGYAVFVIGAKFATKQLPDYKIADIINNINMPFVLIGGKEDIYLGAEINTLLEVKAYNGCGRFNINQSASVIKQAQFVIAHDTGMMHVAAAFKKPTVAIWGNTVPAFGMFPYQTEHKNMEAEGLRCRPCSKIGYNECPKEHFDCMRQIKTDEVVKTAVGYLGVSGS